MPSWKGKYLGYDQAATCLIAWLQVSDQAHAAKKLLQEAGPPSLQYYARQLSMLPGTVVDDDDDDSPLMYVFFDSGCLPGPSPRTAGGCCATSSGCAAPEVQARQLYPICCSSAGPTMQWWEKLASVEVLTLPL